VLDQSFLQSSEYARRQSFLVSALNYSRSLQVLNKARYELRKIWRERQVEALAPGNEATGDPSGAGVVQGTEEGISNTVYKAPNTPAWETAWGVTERLIEQMNLEVAGRDAFFYLVTLSSAIQVDPDPQVRSQFITANELDGLFYPDERLFDLGARASFPVLNLAPIMQGYAEAGQVYLHGFENTTWGGGHWNERGHALAGALISENLCQALAGRARSKSSPPSP